MIGWEDVLRQLRYTVLAAPTTCGRLWREFVEVVERIIDGYLPKV